MPRLEIVQIDVQNALKNYVYLIRDPQTEAVAVVDPTEAGMVLAALEQRGWRLTHILSTHHHNDHTAGNLPLKDRTGCLIVGPRADAARIPGIDVVVADGETVTFGARQARVFDVPGHTRGHIAYHFADDAALFCGDTLFSLGCGRMFEGTPEQFWSSLLKLRALPDDTMVYCAHEYTESNLRFALSVDPDNPALQTRGRTVEALRAEGQPTVPSRLGEEKAANPFLRADDPALQAALGLSGAPPERVFAEVRARKDSF